MDSYSVTSGLSNAMSDAFGRRLDIFLHPDKYPHGIAYLACHMLTSSWKLKTQFFRDMFWYVKNYLDVAEMHPIRRWKAMSSYVTIPISLIVSGSRKLLKWY